MTDEEIYQHLKKFRAQRKAAMVRAEQTQFPQITVLERTQTLALPTNSATLGLFSHNAPVRQTRFCVRASSRVDNPR